LSIRSTTFFKRGPRIMLLKCLPNVSQLLTAISIVAAFSAAAFAQSTWTCTSPKWDILKIMRMNSTWAQDGYYLSGTDQNGGNVYMYQAASDVTYDSKKQWTSGKENYIKRYYNPPANPPNKQEVCSSNCAAPYATPKYVPEFAPGTPAYWGYPADVDLFDTTYIYLWITEIDWNNPYAYKKFNSNNNDKSFPFAPRCAVPGQATIQIPEPYMNQLPTNTIPSTAYQIFPSNAYESGLIDTQNETFTSADCKNGYSWADLQWAFTQVNTAQSGFAMNNQVNHTNPSLDFLPIVYWYNCDSGYANCQHREEFDYGWDPNTGDNYGLVKWQHFSGVNSQSPDQTATFNTMQQYSGPADGHYSYANITFPAPACFQ